MKIPPPNNIYTKSSLKNGYSLVEMLVYVSILSVLAVLVVNVIIVLGQSYGALKATRNVNSAAMTSLERTVREIRLSNSVDTVNSTFGTHPGRLTLSMGATTTEFYLDSGVFKVRQNGSDEGALTQDGTSVTNLVFRYITVGSIESIKIEMTLESTVGKSTKTENFYNFVVLRGSY